MIKLEILSTICENWSNQFCKTGQTSFINKPQTPGVFASSVWPPRYTYLSPVKSAVITHQDAKIENSPQQLLLLISHLFHTHIQGISFSPYSPSTHLLLTSHLSPTHPHTHLLGIYSPYSPYLHNSPS